MELFRCTALELSKMMINKEVSSVEVVNCFNERIMLTEPKLKAFVTLTPELARQTAETVDKRRLNGEMLHPLAGVPVAVKDNMCTRGIRTTCSSRVLEHYVPPYDATVVTAVRNAGMPVLGKTNMDEFAMGSSTENSAFYPTCNPYDLSRVPGGSSGGSAAAVKGAMVPLALGSDTGGSVRQPAALCGVTGIRPTYGRISRYGLIAFASSLDQVGVLSANAADGWELFKHIAGHDPRDSTSLDQPVSDQTNIVDPAGVLKGLKIGYIKEHLGEGFEQDIVDRVYKVLSLFESLGAQVQEVSLSMADYAMPAYYLISPAEASSNLGRYDGVRYGFCAGRDDGITEMFSRSRGEGFGPEVKRRIMLGTYALSAGYYDAYYLQALKVRTLVQREMEEIFNNCDLLVDPTTPATAFKLGEKTKDPIQMYLSDACTLTGALAGYPSISSPAGLDTGGLPIGVQLTARPLREDLLFAVSAVIENGFPVPRIPEPVEAAVRQGEV